MRADGIRVAGPEPLHAPVISATDTPADIGPVDVVLLCVKLWDTDAALAAIRPLVGPATAIISLQNGVTKDDAIRAAYGPDHLVGGTCYIAAGIEAPGVIRQTGAMQRLLFGEFDGTRSTRCEALLSACLAGGITAELSTQIALEIWQKFVFLAGLSGTTATIRKTLGPIRDNLQTRLFLRDVMAEVVAVGRAEGVALPENYADVRLAMTDTLLPEMTSSLHNDLERGNRLEVPWLAGAVVARGQALGVATPLNRAIADILALHANGRAQ